MAKVQTPHEKVGKTVVKKETNPKSKPNHQTRNTYCILCRRSYLKHEAQEHMHGMLHHRELETVLGKDSFHECQACKASSMGLNEYAQHISTTQHKDKLKILMFKNVKPSSLYKTLSRETVSRILERNKTLKKEEKKIMKKKKKKLKQVASQKRAAVQLATATKTKVASKELNPEKSKKSEHEDTETDARDSPDREQPCCCSKQGEQNVQFEKTASPIRINSAESKQKTYLSARRAQK